MSKKDQTTSHDLRVAVVGGGISGLAAAHRLIELDPSIRLTLLESRARLGGVLSTLHEGDFQIEQSADNFITTVPWALDLCNRLGLADELLQTNPDYRQTFVVRQGQLHKLPDGFMMMAPTRVWPFVTTPLLSPLGKLRAAFEYFIPPHKEASDESMASFVRRRLGCEVFDRLVEPLVSAVYAADMEELSVNATLSQFREMELRHGSLIRAMRRQMVMRRKHSQESGPRYSMFVTLKEGLTSLVEAISSRLPDGSVRLDTTLDHIERTADGKWLLTFDETAKEFDAVIIATPSDVAARLLKPIDPKLGKLLAKIQHSGTAIVSVAYKKDQIAHPLDGMGVVVPRTEKVPILACSFSSRKYPHRAPPDRILLRVFVGGARAPEMVEIADQELRRIVLGELSKLLKITGEPLYLSVARWPNTMPQYHIGHVSLVEEIERHLGQLPAIELAGNAYHGVGIPDCIHGGELAAERVVSKLGLVS